MTVGGGRITRFLTIHTPSFELATIEILTVCEIVLIFKLKVCFFSPVTDFRLHVQFGGQSKPEITVDLRGGSVDWASKDKSSKKHVLEVGRS